jgi:hypothetical protein
MKKFTTIFGVMGLMIAMALTVVHASPKPASAAPAAAAAAATAEPAPVPQDHPEIRAALDALKNARVHLHDAKHDFGGHREEALRSIDSAIRQLEICMRYDK